MTDHRDNHILCTDANLLKLESPVSNLKSHQEIYNSRRAWLRPYNLDIDVIMRYISRHSA